jgi:hypothetical protein
MKESSDSHLVNSLEKEEVEEEEKEGLRESQIEL